MRTELKRVLFVDDDEVVRRTLVRLCRRRKLNLEIVEATNGQEALWRLRTESFDLILSDVSMPIMDGIQLLRALQQEQPQALEQFVFHTGSPELVRALGCPVIEKNCVTELQELLASV